MKRGICYFRVDQNFPSRMIKDQCDMIGLKLQIWYPMSGPWLVLPVYDTDTYIEILEDE